MSLVTTSLNAATTGGPGAVAAFDTPKNIVGMTAVQSDTSGDDATVTLEGSLDGVNFFEIGSVATSGQAVSVVYSSSFLVAYLRANLRGYSGSVSVTASVAAHE